MLRRLYLVNAALLVVHEIDSAYWKEWELFRLPGGLGVFLALHVPLVIAVMWGYEQVTADSRAARWASMVLAVAGAMAPLLHGALLLLGSPAFRTTTSIAVLVAVGLVSVVQGTVVATAWRRPRPRTSSTLTPPSR